ncbi:MAG: SUMF1/EgtB/PvdO family nonheme iron enzyme [Mangrovibacterium sp.]
MKRLLIVALITISAIASLSCSKSGNGGELVGARKVGKWTEPSPYGMTFIPRGSINVGPSDQEVNWTGTPTKTVSVDAFWMDDTEITNNEYRQFINFVRDSIARTLLAEQFPEFLIEEDRKGNPIEPPVLNWSEKIDWKDPEVQEALADLYYSEEDQIFGKKEIDTRKLIYTYYWVDYQQAARRKNMYNYETQSYTGVVYDQKGETKPIANRSSFVFKEDTNIYPDTLCWIRDYTYSYNEPWATRYFWHPGFDEYPVVGVNWVQAKAFCSWRTTIQTNYLISKGQSPLQDYRLPTEVEWEYAARGSRMAAMYPWGGYYTRNQEGDFLANFKPLRGNYVEDGGLATMKVGSYLPNDYGLYDMAGNVAEWTITAYDESAYMYVYDLNPNFEYNAKPNDPPVMKRKVIRGGSWKDIALYIQSSTRTFEYQDTVKSYVGFRCVRSTFGNEF